MTVPKVDLVYSEQRHLGERRYTMGADNKKSKRGLASADKETRERVARAGGKASGGNQNAKNQ